ncbi:hypothetical protein CCZ01_08140 [Helicobacter monodelphidis]|uniref:CDP-glycerol glycerophosphotransferase family protein n=1 Tax=Helicobacter sp. 15-1451 TaxID=2004995 RepID=UPI000DCC055E|nr:CDP-glycerol glycerophosphotransferase family protein [Helicobacter sp. 15-1451]RAX56900.1 hypothetical protein CCZ01_08140 [Helicobacter sp. 15-1451]
MNHRFFIYPQGINGESVASVLSLLYPNCSLHFIDDSKEELSLEKQGKNIQANDKVFIASMNHFVTLSQKLEQNGIMNYENALQFCGKQLNKIILEYKLKNPANYYVGIVLSNRFIQKHLVKLDEDLQQKGIKIIYFVFTQELYEKYSLKSLCILSPHAVLEEIDSVDLMVLANGESTHPKVKSLDLTHGFQGPMVFPFTEGQDETFLKHAFSSINYVSCGSKKVHRAYEECFEDLGVSTEILDFGYPKLAQDYVEYESFIKNKTSEHNFVILAFTFLHDINIYIKLIQAILQAGKKAIFMPHPVFAYDLTKELKANFYDSRLLFREDFSSSLECFFHSLCLITDCSSMGYTYPLTTAKPVIVFAKDKEKFFSARLKNEHYFDKRIHYFCDNPSTLSDLIQEIESSQVDYQERIRDYRQNECFYFENSREIIFDWIMQFLTKESNAKCRHH